MGNYKEIGRTIAVAGMILGQTSACASGAREVTLADFSKVPCKFEGQEIKVTGYPADISVNTISTEIFTNTHDCKPQKPHASKAAAKGLEECLWTNAGIHEKIQYIFDLKNTLDSPGQNTKIIHTYTFFADGMDEYKRKIKKHNRKLSGRTEITGKVIKDNAMCYISSNRILVAE